MNTRCTFPNCLGVFPNKNLETCSSDKCRRILHHACQSEFEFSHGVELEMHKWCFKCCNEAVLKERKDRTEVVEGDEIATVPAEEAPNDDDSSLVDLTAVVPPIFLQIPDRNTNSDEALENKDASKVDNLPDISGRNDNVGDKTGRDKTDETVNALNQPIEDESAISDSSQRAIIIPANEENVKPKLRIQKGFIRTSIVICPSLYLYNNVGPLNSVLTVFTEMHGPYSYGRITQVPNRKKT